MILYYEPPEDGEELIYGCLFTETGEPVEGVIITSVLEHGDYDSVSLQFTMMMERVPRMDQKSLLRAVRGIAKINEGLAPEEVSENPRQEK